MDKKFVSASKKRRRKKKPCFLALPSLLLWLLGLVSLYVGGEAAPVAASLDGTQLLRRRLGRRIPSEEEQSEGNLTDTITAKCNKQVLKNKQAIIVFVFRLW